MISTLFTISLIDEAKKKKAPNYRHFNLLYFNRQSVNVLSCGGTRAPFNQKWFLS